MKQKRKFYFFVSFSSASMSLYANDCVTFYGGDRPLDRATAYAREHGLPVFGHEKGKGRYFIVTGYNNFFVNYMRCKAVRERVYHEYIRGSCNLYIDIDAERYNNPNLYDDDKACSLVVQAIMEELWRQFGIHKQSVDVVELDSSTRDKLSRHYIFNIRDENGRYTIGWKNSSHCGIFMRILSARINKERYPGLFVSAVIGKRKTQKFIVDLQPYGRNKCMRTYMSCKPGDCQRLLRTAEEKKEGSTEPKYVTFLKSMICVFAGNDDRKLSRVLQMTNTDSSSDVIPSQIAALAKVVHCRRKRYINEDCLDVRSSQDVPSDYLKLVKSTLKQNMYSVVYRQDKDIVRAWVYDKYCRVKGSCHRKNHVFYEFNFATGVYYQSCLSDACAGRQSKHKPIPNYVPKKRHKTVMLPLSEIFPMKQILNYALAAFNRAFFSCELL